MNIVKIVFYLLHMAGLIGLIATLTIALSKPIKKLSAGTLHSAWLQFISGAVLAGMESSEEDFNNSKVGIKLLVLIVIIALGYRNVKKATVSKNLLLSMFGLVVLNILIATFV